MRSEHCYSCHLHRSWSIWRRTEQMTFSSTFSHLELRTTDLKCNFDVLQNRPPHHIIGKSQRHQPFAPPAPGSLEKTFQYKTNWNYENKKNAEKRGKTIHISVMVAKNLLKIWFSHSPKISSIEAASFHLPRFNGYHGKTYQNHHVLIVAPLSF